MYVLNPTYTLDYIKKLDTSGKEVRSIHGDTYLPGIVGLNNIKANDYCNVILQVYVPSTYNSIYNLSN